MKRSTLIGALILSLAAGSAAMADPRDHGRDYDRHDDGRGHSYDHRDNDHRDRGYAYRHDYRDDHRYRQDYRPRYGTYYRPHGYYSHRWVRGERLPVAFYARPYVIADYRGWGLYGPPRGYHWVRVDGDAVLAAVATGIVLDTVFDAFH